MSYFTAYLANLWPAKHIIVPMQNYLIVSKVTWPKKDCVKKTDESEEHWRVHVVLVIDLTPEQNDVRRVEKSSEQSPENKNNISLRTDNYSC